MATLTRQTVSLDEAQRAIAVVIDAAEHDHQPMAAAMVDAHGDLLACARMNGAPARVLRHAIRKAYTAAVMGRDTLKFKADLHDRGGNLAEWGDDQLTTLQGGVAIRLDGAIVGGIGVGGNTVQRDTEIAHIALKAVNLMIGEA